MARLAVNPTRMEMTRLKKRLKTASRGHKLLKDKRDELMKHFLEAVRYNKRLRSDVEKKLMQVYGSFSAASALMSAEMLEQSFMYPKQSIGIDIDYKNLMSVEVPKYRVQYSTEDAGDLYPYGFASTPAELDDSVRRLEQVTADLLKLAEAEKTVMLLAEEIERTRRRVNALEYVMIPQLEETIRYISMKLDENERGNNTRLMKVKDLMLKDAHNYDA